MQDTYVTVVGNAVATPTLRRTSNGVAVTSFRIASTSRRFDRSTEAWTDGDRFFATVNCWRQQAENVVESVHGGDPVIVHGRMYTRDYVANEVTRTTYEIDAEAVGPDLTRGTAQFAKRRREPALSVELDESGMPADLSAEFGPGSDVERELARSAHLVTSA